MPYEHEKRLEKLQIREREREREFLKCVVGEHYLHEKY